VATFGDTSAGGSSLPSNADRAIVGRFQAPASGTITAIDAFWTADGTALNFKGVVYSDAAGPVPSSLLGTGNSASATTTGGDQQSSGLSVAITSGTFYWLGVVESNFTNSLQTDGAGTGTYSIMDACGFASPASSWTQNSSGTDQVNVYATYTPSGGGTPQTIMLTGVGS
jgi:hypothetical protein